MKTAWERFLVYVEMTDTCWLWRGQIVSPPRRNNDYGRFCLDGKKVPAHRAAWIMQRGPIPDRLFVLHACDTPRCVNPSHLWLGTARDNALDMKIKGRSTGGERNNTTRLTAVQVLKIRGDLAGVSYRRIAEEFGVSYSCIQHVRSGYSWSNPTALACLAAAAAEVTA